MPVTGQQSCIPYAMCMFPFSKLRLKIWKSIGPASLPTKRSTVTSIETKTAATGAQPPASVRANIAIAHVNPAVPAIQMALLLPKGWNGKVVMLGGGSANNEAPANFSGDALKTVSDVANALVGRFYGKQPDSRYFIGGREALDLGAANVKNFARYYEVPGYGHAASTAFNANWDLLRALDHWVSAGTAPTAQVVSDTAGVPGRTRPLCEFHTWPR